MSEQSIKQQNDELEDLTIEELDQISGGVVSTISSSSCPFCTFSSISPA
jgi:bacteriocin-like protein